MKPTTERVFQIVHIFAGRLAMNAKKPKRLSINKIANSSHSSLFPVKNAFGEFQPLLVVLTFYFCKEYV